MNIIEKIAEAIWEDQNLRLKDKSGINSNYTWDCASAPNDFWDSFRADAKAAIKVMKEFKGKC